MAGRITIQDPVRMFDIVNMIHDNFFSVDDIMFEPDSSSLRIKFKRSVIDPDSVKGKFWFLRKYKQIYFESYLTVHHVETYEVHDFEKVGEYDFNTIQYDSTGGIVTILTGIPIDIRIKVSQFKLSVELTDNEIENIG